MSRTSDKKVTHVSTQAVMQHMPAKPLIKSLSTAALASTLLLTGCQTMTQSSNQTTTSLTAEADRLESFRITGKIGVTSTAENAQSGSAFYAWGQDDERFAIELTGALGIGFTTIDYDGQTATLTSEKTGTLSADNPEDLLEQATGWRAPISQLPYWISGHSAPSDVSEQTDDNGRLTSATNGDWSASFTYDDNERLPDKITARHSQGHKVVMTILHHPIS